MGLVSLKGFYQKLNTFNPVIGKCLKISTTVLVVYIVYITVLLSYESEIVLYTAIVVNAA